LTDNSHETLQYIKVSRSLIKTYHLPCNYERKPMICNSCQLCAHWTIEEKNFSDKVTSYHRWSVHCLSPF